MNVLDVDDERKQAIIRRGYANAARYSTRQMTDSYCEIYVNLAGKTALVAKE